MFGNLIGEFAALPFRLANIPFKVVSHVAEEIDPDEITPIKAVTDVATKPLDAVADVLSNSIRKAIDE